MSHPIPASGCLLAAVLLGDWRLQLDLSGGGGLDGDAPDGFVSAGATLRFDAPWQP